MISDQLHQLTLNIATSFRLGMEAQASEGLVTLVDALLEVLQAGGGVDAERLNQLLAIMLAAQSRRDFLYLADQLQYELPALFSKVSGA